jgi:hypothetical protein
LSGDRTNREIVIRTVFTVGVGGALTIAGLVDTRNALEFAVGSVSVTVSTADRVIMRAIAIPLTVVSRDASTKVSLLDTFATHETFVVI